MQGDWTQDIKVVLISPCYSWLFLQGQRWGRNLEETPLFFADQAFAEQNSPRADAARAEQHHSDCLVF